MAATSTTHANGEVRLEPTALAIAAEIKVLEVAIRSGRVTFHSVAHAWFRLRDPRIDAKDREEFGALFPKLVEAFSEPRGGIITAYLCEYIPVAAVLTDIDRAASLTEGLPVHKPSEEAFSDDPSPGNMSARDRARATRARRAEHRRAMAAASSSAIHLEPLEGQPATGRRRSCCSVAWTCTTARCST